MRIWEQRETDWGLPERARDQRRLRGRARDDPRDHGRVRRRARACARLGAAFRAEHAAAATSPPPRSSARSAPALGVLVLARRRPRRTPTRTGRLRRQRLTGADWGRVGGRLGGGSGWPTLRPGPMPSRDRLALPLVCAVTAGLTAAVLLTVGPPGIDTPAHLFMTWVFRHAGFQLWNNYWYDGRYDFVGYSLALLPRRRGRSAWSRRRSPRRPCWPSRSPPSAGASGAEAANAPCLMLAATATATCCVSGVFPFLAGAAAGAVALACAQRRQRIGFGVAMARLARLLAARVRPCRRRARGLRPGRAETRSASPAATRLAVAALAVTAAACHRPCSARSPPATGTRTTRATCS